MPSTSSFAPATDSTVHHITWGGHDATVRPGEWIVHLSSPSKSPRTVSGESEIAQLLQRRRPDVHVGGSLGNDSTLVTAPAGLSHAALARTLQNLRGFKYVEPNFVYHVDTTIPNDPLFGQLWGLNNTGQSGGTVDADIDAPEAWDISTGSASVVVGVIDTGVDYNHPDLATNIWTNPGEIAGNGIDDDQDGFVDDVHGYDFVGDGDGDPMDDFGHGTHVAGTIAAVGNNGIGVTGVSWNAKIMALKFLDSHGQGDTADAVEAINYATMMRQRGVNIRLTSNSWSGGDYSQALNDAIAASGSAGMLFIAAAGNDATNTDASPEYPSSYNLPNVISVAALDRNNGLAQFSNYGATSVDIGAPGVDILSTVPQFTFLGDGSGYHLLSGTSMATPHVAGVAALAWGTAPNATFAQVRDAIFAGGDNVASLAGKSVTGKRLNARATLDQLGLQVLATSPAAGSVVSVRPTQFRIDFTAAVNPTTVQPADLKVNGIAATSVSLLDADTAQFTFASTPVTAQGLQTITMAPGAIARSNDGRLLGAYSGTFRYDVLLLAVSASTPAAGSDVSPPMTSLRLTFNEDVAAHSVSADDLQLNIGSVTGVTIIDARNIQFALAGLTAEGALTATVAAGALTDVFGNTGIGWTGTFNLDIGASAFPPLQPVGPRGELVFDSSTLSGVVGVPTDVDSYTLDLDAGQVLTAVVHAAASGLRLTVTLRNPSGETVGSISAAAPGGDAILQTAAIATAGQYSVDVGGAAGVGEYTVKVVLNGAEEFERHGGASNNSPASAQSLDAGLHSLDGSVSQLAVRGDTISTDDDYFSLSVAAGQTLSMMANRISGAGSLSVFEVLDSAGVRQILATSVPGGGRRIEAFVAPTTGVYRIHLAGDATGLEYALVATIKAAIDFEANDSLSTAQTLARPGGAIGYVSDGVGALPNEAEPNDDLHAGTLAADLFAANDLSGSFSSAGVAFTFQAVVNGSIAAPDGGDADYYKVFARPGDTLTITMSPAAGSTVDPYLSLYNGNVTLLSQDDQSGGGGSAKITYTGFPSANYYYIAGGSTRSTSGAYVLTARLVTTNLFSSRDTDYYAINVRTGDNLSLQTRTPGDGTGEFVNALNPALELYSSAGGLLASDDNAAPDGRNASLAYTATGDGVLYARVRASGGSATGGEYVLNVTGATGSLPAFTVSATNPVDGATVAQTPSFAVTFNHPVRSSSLTADDLRVDGIASVAAVQLDASTFTFTFPGTLSDGDHSVTIAAGAVMDAQGTPLQSYGGHFLLDSGAPRVTSSSVQEGTSIATGDQELAFQFDESLNAANLDGSDLSLVGAALGPIAPSSAPQYDPATRTVRLTYANLAEDAYTFTLLSGDGAFEDVAGNDLDGEPTAWPISPNRSGDGIVGGNFVVHFATDAGTRPVAPLLPAVPAGSLIYQGNASTRLTSSLDVDDFTVALDAGQTITVTARPDAALRPAISLYGPTNALLGAAQPTTAGQDAVLQTIAVSTAGTYRISLGAVSGNGAAQVFVTLNAAQEAEDHNGASNNSIATAQDLTGSLLTLSSSATRGAVVGTSTGAGDDYYKVSASAGDLLSATVSPVTTSAALNLRIYTAAGTQLATGASSATNVGRSVDALAVPAAGDYFIRIDGQATAYDLVTITGGALDFEPNSSVGSPQPIGPRSTVVGAVGGTDAQDVFALTLSSGSSVTVLSRTPAGGPNDFANVLDPRIEVRDPSGAIVATDDNGAPDGRNALATIAPSTTGTYTIAVISASGTEGEYVLDVQAIPSQSQTEVVRRSIFYNDSAYDGHDPSANSGDDGAIATDKIALRRGETATFSSYTNFVSGINGVMVDIASLPAGAGPGVTDFGVDVSTDGGASWTPATAAPAVSVRRSAGAMASDRVTLVWPDGSLVNEWLRITVKPSAATGLSSSDVFYFGNAIAETGNGLPGDALAIVDASDFFATRDHLRYAVDLAPITWRWDFNRDGVTDATDLQLVRSNANTASAALKLITAPQQVSSAVQAPGGGASIKPPEVIPPTGDAPSVPSSPPATLVSPVSTALSTTPLPPQFLVGGSSQPPATSTKPGQKRSAIRGIGSWGRS